MNRSPDPTSATDSKPTEPSAAGGALSGLLAPKRQGFHIMAKPIGPICNLDCKYCYYLEKENLYPSNENFKMPEPMLESYIRQYIEAQNVPEINFAWQGGEPTLLGVNFFRKVVEFQKKYANGKKVTNALQTNGTLIDDEWAQFFAENEFLIGASVDGPRKIHDFYRVDKGDKPTFEKVLRGINLLKKHGAEFNTLTVVQRNNVKHPLDVYNFLKEIGSGFIQFIPIVERVPEDDGGDYKLDFAEPPQPGEREKPLPVTKWTVDSEAYGDFLITIFDEWVRKDVGKVFVQMFDVALGQWSGYGASLCVFAKKCGNALAMEHNGDLFSCDHYVYPRYKLGNIIDTPLGDMVNSAEQWKFGDDKSDTLPKFCRECEVRFACNGECPKHRFMRTPDGEAGLNYLCPGYKKFFNHVDPYMKTMAQLLRAQRPPAEIMEMIKQKESKEVWRSVGRNDPCPCGSGKKYKKCCGRVLKED